MKRIFIAVLLAFIAFVKPYAFEISSNTTVKPTSATTASGISDLFARRCVSPEDFGAAGTGSGDDGPAINLAITAARSTGSHVCLQGKTYNIRTTVNVPSYATIIGAGRQNTILSTDRSITIVAVSGTALPGSHVSYVTLKDFKISGGSIGKTGLDLKAVSVSKFENLEFSGFTDAQLKLYEVFDSWVQDSNFKGHVGTTTPTVVIHYGGWNDNTNIVRWIGNTWETNDAGAIMVVPGPSSTNSVYGQWFDGCKWEDTSSNGTYAYIRTTSNTEAVRGLTFTNSYIHYPSTPNPAPAFFEALGGVENIIVDKAFVTYSGSISPSYLISLTTNVKTVNIGVTNSYFNANAARSAFHPIATNGNSNNIFAYGNDYNQGTFYPFTDKMTGSTQMVAIQSGRVSATDIHALGKVGIGGVVPSVQLEVSGTISATSISVTKAASGVTPTNGIVTGSMATTSSSVLCTYNGSEWKKYDGTNCAF